MLPYANSSGMLLYNYCFASSSACLPGMSLLFARLHNSFQFSNWAAPVGMLLPVVFAHCAQISFPLDAAYISGPCWSRILFYYPCCRLVIKMIQHQMQMYCWHVCVAVPLNHVHAHPQTMLCNLNSNGLLILSHHVVGKCHECESYIILLVSDKI